MVLQRQSDFPPRPTWIPYLVLLGALLLTAVATYSAARVFLTRDKLHFENGVQQIKLAVEQRMAVYTEMLVLGSALCGATSEIRRGEFRNYVTGLRVDQRYPGIQGIGFSMRVPPGEKEDLVRQMRKEGLGDFRIWPESERPEYHTIIYLEPLDSRNQRAIGFDMGTEPVRRAAMDRARDTGEAAASGKVILVQETGQSVQPGFLVYVPVYRGGEVPVTVEQRRRDLVGFVYAPFRTRDLLQGILGRENRLPVAFRVFDGPARSPETQLYQSVDPAKTKTSIRYRAPEQLIIAGHIWTFEFAPGLHLASTSAMDVVPFLGLGGLFVSLVLFRLTSLQAKAYSAAEKSAADLRISEAEVSRLNENLELRVHARTAALEESNEQLEAFTYTVAHDLRAPLRAMQGFSQALLEDCADQLDRRGKDYAARVIAAARRMDSLIQDLLSYSRLSRAPLSFEPVDLKILLNRVLAAFADDIDKKHAVVAVPPTLPEVLAHASTLELILTNLLSNALKFTAPGAAPQVEIWAERNGTGVRLNVRDDGIGIAPEYHQRIFGVFERLHGSEAYPGTGIGLAIVKKGIERMRGQVGVASKVDHGSTFWIQLPAPSAK